MSEVKDLEVATNDYLSQIQEVQYLLEHFLRKTNKSTALEVRNAGRQLDAAKKTFKAVSIGTF